MGSDFGYLESLLCRIRRLIFIAFLVVSFWFSFSCHGHLFLYGFRFICFIGGGDDRRRKRRKSGQSATRTSIMSCCKVFIGQTFIAIHLLNSVEVNFGLALIMMDRHAPCNCCHAIITTHERKKKKIHASLSIIIPSLIPGPLPCFVPTCLDQ